MILDVPYVLPWDSQLHIGEGAHPLLAENNDSKYLQMCRDRGRPSDGIYWCFEGLATFSLGVYIYLYRPAGAKTCATGVEDYINDPGMSCEPVGSGPIATGSV